MELAGAFLAGLFGLRSAQAIRSPQKVSLEDVVEAIREEAEETRRALGELRMQLTVLLDRDDHRPTRRLPD